MTSKELARLLGVSPATVSMALNGKPGVNSETRAMILAEAKKYHVSVRSSSELSLYTILLIEFQQRLTLLSASYFTNEVVTGVKQTCKASGCSLEIIKIIGIRDLIRCFQDISPSDTVGIILMSTDMVKQDLQLLPAPPCPIVLLDNHAYSYPFDCVKIDNVSSSFAAVNFLIERTKQKPGYLRSSYFLNNFAERAVGFEQAIIYNGMSGKSAVIHDLPPSIEGAYAEMSMLLKKGIDLAPCYFADDDLIAIGAMQAMQAHAIRIPEDVSVIGFDDIEMSSHTDPPLTTMHVPKYHFGATAVKRLLTLIRDNSLFPVTTEMTANLVIRGSVC